MSAGVAYIPAERKLQGCFMDLPAEENIGFSSMKLLWRFPSMRKKVEVALAKKWFARFAVRPLTGISQPMATFSGGNQQKIIYGKWFQREPRLFLLDEPTQGVDVGAKAELHQALFAAAEEGAAVLVSSSDVDELVTLCDRIVVLRGGRVAAELEGSRISVHDITRAALGV
jgi:ribose transport system ATP-binding protein